MNTSPKSNPSGKGGEKQRFHCEDNRPECTEYASLLRWCALQGYQT